MQRLRIPSGTGAIAGALGGAMVGVADGVRAAVLTGAAAVPATALLVAGVDALAGAVALGLAEAFVRLHLWGRGRRARGGARAVALALGALGSGAAAAGLVAVTAARNNRFLAAGLAALAALAALGAYLLVGPSVARVLSRRAAPSAEGDAGDAPAVDESAPPWWAHALFGGLLTLVPLAATFLVVWRTRAPLLGAALAGRVALAALAAAALPLAMILGGAVARRRATPKAAAWAALGTAVLAVLGFVARSWEQNLRFAPWTDIAIGALIVAVSVGLVRVVARRAPRAGWARLAVAAAGVALALAAFFLAGASEAARKAATARAGLAAPILAAVRALADRDHDGYPRVLGGGDCDDGDPEVHPGARDWPSDGVDQDCDGADAVIEALPSAPMPPRPEGVPPDLNVLFITIDTLRADALGTYGARQPTSPTLDALAAQGAVFENAWAHAPSTRYSMPAIITGRWPSAIEWEPCTGCAMWWPRVSPKLPTLGERMKAAGYFTAALFNFVYFNREDARGFERGMDLYDNGRSVLHVAVDGPRESRGTSAREMSDDAIKFVDAHKAQKFFLWVHYYDPHLSYERHEGVADFGDDRWGRYLHEVRFTDDQIGRLLAHLAQLGLSERTAIVVTGDHGEGFGEHGVTEHGYHLYAAQTKVPLIVRVPGLAPRRLRAPAGHVDLAPTLVNLAGGVAVPTFLGRSLLPLVAGVEADGPDARSPVYQEVFLRGESIGFGETRRRALASPTRHMVWNAEPANTSECYDLAGDPQETHDLWGRTPADAACDDLSRRLRRTVATLELPPGFAEKLAFGVVDKSPPAPRHASPGRIGDVLAYVGWDGPDAVKAGEDIELVHHFDVLGRPPAGWRLFVHVLGPGGTINADHAAVEGVYPLERWKPGQRIRDRHRVHIPPGAPAGEYQVLVGMWRGRERLPVTPAARDAGENRLRAFSFQVR